MLFELIVTTPFGDYNRGDLIVDPAVVQYVLDNNPRWVVQIPVTVGNPP